MSKKDEYKEALRVEPYIKKAIQHIQEGNMVAQVREVKLKVFNGKHKFFIGLDNAVLEKMVQQYIDSNVVKIMSEAFKFLLIQNKSLLSEATKEAEVFIQDALDDKGNGNE